MLMLNNLSWTQALEPLADADLDAYLCCHELYGSSRMLLACLQPSELKQVDCPTAACWNLESLLTFWHRLLFVLAILRPLRGLLQLLGLSPFDDNCTVNSNQVIRQRSAAAPWILQ